MLWHEGVEECSVHISCQSARWPRSYIVAEVDVNAWALWTDVAAQYWMLRAALLSSHAVCFGRAYRPRTVRKHEERVYVITAVCKKKEQTQTPLEKTGGSHILS